MTRRANRHPQPSDRKEITMYRIRISAPVRRLAGALAALAGALLAAATAAPAAFALPRPPIGGGGRAAASPTVRVITGGMPGWQVALIAVGAALLAAAAAVFLDRTRATRRHQAAPGT
jgi:hypothetical protein